MSTNGKVAVVTGSAKGIGKAVAKILSGYGYSIAIADLDIEKAQITADEIKDRGGDAKPFEMDVSSSTSVQQAVEQIVETYKTIDALINCAGIVCSEKLHNLDEKLWDKVMNVNLKSVYLVSKVVVPYMIAQKNGRIINFSSQAGKIGELGNGVYCASKAGVSMLTQVQSLELAEYNINVNAVAPGYTNTEIMQSVFQKRGPLENITPEKYEKNLLESVPLKRMAEPDEIGELIAFLVSDKANYITGITITIAGGKTLI